MKIAIILNGISRKKKKFYKEIHPSLVNHFDLEVLETRYSGHAEELATNLTKQNTPIVLAAGGDGTLHQVINGALKTGLENLPTFGIIPLGSGNDFARSCAVRAEPDEIIQLVKGQPKLTDVGIINCNDQNGNPVNRYFINVCSVGMGPEVVKQLQKTSRAWGPDFSYFTSIVRTFFSQRPQEIQCKTPSWEWQGKVRVTAIANGKSFGNAIYIAPDAMLDDGILNSFIAGDVPLWKFLLFLQTLKSGKKLLDERILYKTAKSVELTSADSCALEAEGEWIGWLPAKIDVLTGRVNFIR